MIGDSNESSKERSQPMIEKAFFWGAGLCVATVVLGFVWLFIKALCNIVNNVGNQLFGWDDDE